MSSLALASVTPDAGLKGSETPRFFTPPLRELTDETTLGFECIDFLEKVVGWELFPWQKWLYVHALELAEDGRLRFDTILVLIARQNGKTRWLLGLALYRLYVMESRLVISTAQDLDKAEATLDEGHTTLDEVPSLAAEKVKYLTTNGKHRIILTGRRFWRAQVASRKGGRSLSADLAILDELREHTSWDAWNAIAPTTTAVEDGQVVAVSNAGDAKSAVLRFLRDEALREIRMGRSVESTTFLAEWSAPKGSSLRDPQALAMANPSMGWQFPLRKLLGKVTKGSESGNRTEYLCEWVDVIEQGYFPEEAWPAQLDRESVIGAGMPVSLALDISWSRSRSHLVVCGQRAGGDWHVEVVASRAGTDWVIPWLRARLPVDGEPTCWWDGRLVVQARGAPASGLKEDLEAAGVEVVEWGGPDLSAGTGKFYDALVAGRIWHRSQPLLAASVRGAKSKQSGDSTWIDRRNSVGDASPAIGAVAAFWDASRPVEEFESAYESGGLTVV